MDYILVGKYVNTHGLKGEIKIKSNFAYKSLIFQKDFTIYLGKEKKEMTISSYRPHNGYDMVTFYGFDKIEDVLPYKGMQVYIKRNSIKIDGYFDEDYIGLFVYTDHLIGKVYGIEKGKYQDLLIIKNENKEYLVPKVDAFIKKISLDENKLWINEIGGLIDEN